MGSDDKGGGGPSPAAGVFEVLKDADAFRETAMFVFGKYGWLRQTANAFGINESTVHRWVNEQVEIPYHALSTMAAWRIVFEKTGMRPPEHPAMRAKQAEKARKAKERSET